MASTEKVKSTNDGEEQMQPSAGLGPDLAKRCAKAFLEPEARGREIFIRHQWGKALQLLGRKPKPESAEYIAWKFHYDAHFAVFIQDLSDHRLEIERRVVATEAVSETSLNILSNAPIEVHVRELERLVKLTSSATNARASAEAVHSLFKYVVKSRTCCSIRNSKS